MTASSSITSTMQDDFQLTITAILRHGASVHGQSECVTWLGDRGRHTSYAEIARNDVDKSKRVRRHHLHVSNRLQPGRLVGVMLHVGDENHRPELRGKPAEGSELLR